jgi:hypothetical protein
MKCQTPLCDQDASVTDLCAAHYASIRRDFSAMFRRATGSRHHRSPEDRFFSFVSEGPGGCWNWTGQRDRDGYAKFRDERGKTARAHRWAYRFFKGDVLEDLHLDHLCRNRSCVNPEHLEPVTNAENVRRGAVVRASASHCANGHLWADDNERRNSAGYRYCKSCLTDAGRRYRQKLRASA